ncbi:hypothetical protein D3C86_1465020 [compost metagenome]
MGIDQALVTRSQRGITPQQLLRPALIVLPPVAHGAGLRRQQGEPAIEFLVQCRFGKHRKARRQPQVGRVAPRQWHLLAGTGDLLQYVAPQQQLAVAGGFDTDAIGTAHGAKQHCQWTLPAGQFDPRFGEVRAGAPGDEAMPDTADPLFQFDGKGHGFFL